VFDEQKLRWMNGRYLREMSVDELQKLLEERLGRPIPREAVEISQEKMQTLDDFWTLAGFLVEPQPTDEKAWNKVMKNGAADTLEKVREALARTEPFTPESIES
jgi:glutamyl-tRNA synthetase